MKKTVIIISVVLVLAIAVTAAFLIFKKSPSTPLEKIEDAFEKSYDAAEKANSDAITKSNSFKTSGSVEISADLEQLLKTAGLDLDLDAMLKIYMDEKNGKFAEELAVNIDGQTIVDALLTMNSENVALKSDTFLGNKAYGITFADILDKFDSSVFGPDGAYSLGITADELKEGFSEAFKESLGVALDSVELTAELTALSEKVTEEFKEVLYTSLNANATFAEADGALTVAGIDIRTTDVSVIMTEEQTYTVLLDVLKYLKESESFKELFIAAADAGNISTTISTDTTEEVTNYSGEDIYNEFIEATDEFMAELTSLLEEVSESEAETSDENEGEENTLTVTFHISKDNDELIGINLYVTSEEELVEMEVKFGPSSADIDQISFTAKMDDLTDSMEADTVSLEYVVSEDSADTYKTSINISSVEYYDWDGEIDEDRTALDLTLEWDKKEYDYDLVLNVTSEDETTKVTLGGICKPEEDKSTITVTSFGAQGLTLRIGEIRFIVRYSDTAPEIGEFSEVLDMSEDEVAEIISTFEEFTSALDMFLN